MFQTEIQFPEIFVSYCWANSRNASEKSMRINEEALGWGDPRSIKEYLQTQGLGCWIDTEMIGKEKVNLRVLVLIIKSFQKSLDPIFV